MKKIGLGKYKTLIRIFVILGEIESRLVRGHRDHAHAETVPGTKAVHHFVVDGTWKTVWPLTFLPDSLERERQGGGPAAQKFDG